MLGRLAVATIVALGGMAVAQEQSIKSGAGQVYASPGSDAVSSAEDTRSERNLITSRPEAHSGLIELRDPNQRSRIETERFIQVNKPQFADAYRNARKNNTYLRG